MQKLCYKHGISFDPTVDEMTRIREDLIGKSYSQNVRFVTGIKSMK